MHRAFLLFLSLCLCVAPVSAQVVRPLDLSQQSFVRSDRLGIAFIAYLNNLGLDADARYRQALELGAGWHRWPMYWNFVESTPGAYDWSGYDRLAEMDRRNGLQTNAILLGKPDFYRDGGSIANLRSPVFSDGTDVPGPGKLINASNHWARYVHTAVNRYKPGGTLAQLNRWPPGAGIRVWEAWNEPDLEMFWQGSQSDYARLLKVTYLAAKQADPEAQVMFGGLAYGNPDTDDWLSSVLAIYANDPSAPPNNWYMDIVGLHSYSDSRRTGLVVTRVKDTLARYGLSQPIWLNETGVPVWDDYPGPTWAADSPAERRLRATQDQQAAYFVQSAAYAFAAGADKVFYHQLYDDCGNDGRDFAPDTGEAGDAYGIYRNLPTYDCFSQHPQPGSARPVAEAYRTVAQIFGNGTFSGGSISRADGATRITFERPVNERVTVLWNNQPQENTLSWEAESSAATLYGYGNRFWQIAPTAGSYEITLPAARINDDPARPPGALTTIGGTTYIMVERVTGELLADSDPFPLVTPRAEIRGQIGSILDGSTGSVGTTSLSGDIAPPSTSMQPLPDISGATFNVVWSGTDNAAIEKYLVWVRVNDGEWGPWIETQRTSSIYTGEPGNTYAFSVWAVDTAGNWSLNTDLQPQAITRVE